MIDPITALEGLQTAISVVKKASKVASDLAGLTPSIAKLFDAKSTATKAMLQAKRTGGKSNLGAALQIEMALDEAKRFEEQLKMLFMQAGRIDVWNATKARQAEMDRDDAKEMAALHAEEKRRKEAEAEQMQWAVAIVIIVMFIGAVGWGINEVSDLCAVHNARSWLHLPNICTPRSQSVYRAGYGRVGATT
jgi:hypothetical protein